MDNTIPRNLSSNSNKHKVKFYTQIFEKKKKIETFFYLLYTLNKNENKQEKKTKFSVSRSRLDAVDHHNRHHFLADDSDHAQLYRRAFSLPSFFCFCLNLPKF